MENENNKLNINPDSPDAATKLQEIIDGVVKKKLSQNANADQYLKSVRAIEAGYKKHTAKMEESPDLPDTPLEKAEQLLKEGKILSEDPTPSVTGSKDDLYFYNFLWEIPTVPNKPFDTNTIGDDMNELRGNAKTESYTVSGSDFITQPQDAQIKVIKPTNNISRPLRRNAGSILNNYVKNDHIKKDPNIVSAKESLPSWTSEEKPSKAGQGFVKMYVAPNRSTMKLVHLRPTILKDLNTNRHYFENFDMVDIKTHDVIVEAPDYIKMSGDVLTATKPESKNSFSTISSFIPYGESSKPDNDRLDKNTFCQRGDNIYMSDTNRTEVLRFETNGDIYVKGQFAQCDAQVVDAMRVFLRGNRLIP